MYKELEKYKTGRKIDKLALLPEQTTITIECDEYVSNLGDLIEDFIKHQTLPFWKRKYYHKHLTKMYKKILNQFAISWGF
jgi:hypothetical protein